jgi:hypothetical protein
VGIVARLLAARSRARSKVTRALQPSLRSRCRAAAKSMPRRCSARARRTRLEGQESHHGRQLRLSPFALPTLIGVLCSDVTASLHDRDFYGWVEQQCQALRNRDSSQLDWGALEEELQALGRQEFRELVSRLAVLLGHLLQWELQPQRRSRSWFLRIREQRRAIARLLEQNPSLRAKTDEALSDGFQGGVDLVLRDTDLSLRTLPVACPWSLEESLDPATLCDTRGDWGDLAG